MSRAPKSNNSGKKEETIEKIKEIKRRQRNWLKQRDEQLERSKSLDVVKKSDSKVSTNLEKSRITGSANNRYSTQEKYIPNSKNFCQDSNDLKLKPKGKFKSWLQERGDNSVKTPENNHQGVIDRRLKGQLQNETLSPSTSEVNILRVDSARSAQYATPDPGYHGYDLHGDVEERSGILSPDQFDFLADKIIAKVKNDLHIKDQRVTNITHINDSLHYGPSVEQNKPKNIDINKPKDLESHYCKVCRSLMTPSVHSPMLLIPCGHTVCAACAKERQLCIHCGCEINSVTCNIMLQQIIQDFQQCRKPLLNASHGQQIREYSASMYSDKSKDTDYISSMKTLQTRHSILSEELRAINTGLSITASNIEKEKRHIENISKEEEKVRNELLRLEKKLRSLHEHKSDFTDNCKALESKHLDETNKKSLLQDSLCSIEQEMEKVELLAEEMQSYTYS